MSTDSLSIYFYILLCLRVFSIWVFYFLAETYSYVFYSFWCNYNWDFLKTSLSGSLLLICRNTIDFCVFILYPATLLNSLLSSNSSLVRTLGFSIYNIMTFANNDIFTSSLMIWVPFISFSCLISVARTSNTMLNRNGNSVHPCLSPDLWETSFSFSPLSSQVLHQLWAYVEVAHCWWVICMARDTLALMPVCWWIRLGLRMPGCRFQSWCGSAGE